MLARDHPIHSNQWTWRHRSATFARTLVVDEFSPADLALADLALADLALINPGAKAKYKSPADARTSEGIVNHGAR